MKVHATLNNLRIAPRKVRLVTHALVGVDTREALTQLSKQIKKTSDPITTLLKSAVANAENNFGLAGDNLYIKEIRVGDGLRIKRWLPRAFGRATPLMRRGANVTIILEERIEGLRRTENKQPVAKEEALVVEEEKKEENAAKSAKPEFEVKKEKMQGNKPTANKVVKKMFQRKSS